MLSQKTQKRMNLDELTNAIRGSIFEVVKELGSGLPESVYEASLLFELTNGGLFVQSQVPVPVQYKAVQLEVGFRLNLLVEGEVIIEITSVETWHDVHKKQLLTYLKLTDKTVGILVNFNATHLKDKESQLSEL